MSGTVTTTGLPASVTMNALILSQAAAAGSQADMSHAFTDMSQAFMAMIERIEGVVMRQAETIQSLESRNAALEGRLQQNLDAATAREQALQDQIGALGLRLTGSETEIVSLRQQIDAANQAAAAALARANTHTHLFSIPRYVEAYGSRTFGTGAAQ